MLLSYGSAAHAASSTGDRPGAISERQAHNSKPSTTKTKKAWSYTFSIYFLPDVVPIACENGTDIDRKHIYILCMPICVQSYKHGDGAKLWVCIRQINNRHNVYLGSNFFTETNCSSSSSSSSSSKQKYSKLLELLFLPFKSQLAYAPPYVSTKVSARCPHSAFMCCLGKWEHSLLPWGALNDWSLYWRGIMFL